MRRTAARSARSSRSDALQSRVENSLREHRLQKDSLSDGLSISHIGNGSVSSDIAGNSSSRSMLLYNRLSSSYSETTREHHLQKDSLSDGLSLSHIGGGGGGVVSSAIAGNSSSRSSILHDRLSRSYSELPSRRKRPATDDDVASEINTIRGGRYSPRQYSSATLASDLSLGSASSDDDGGGIYDQINAALDLEESCGLGGAEAMLRAGYSAGGGLGDDGIDDSVDRWRAREQRWMGQRERERKKMEADGKMSLGIGVHRDSHLDKTDEDHDYHDAAGR